jgi:hypothetical protein
MKIKTRELTDKALDWAVAIAAEGKGYPLYWRFYTDGQPNKPHWGESGASKPFSPSTDGSQCMAIIDREGIDLRCGVGKPLLWAAFVHDCYHNVRTSTGMTGPTPLVAAMRCFVASRLGQEIDVPDELLTASEVASESAAPEPTLSPQRPRGG